MCSATAVTTATLVIVLCLVTITARGEAVSELEWFACPEHSDLSCAYFNIPLDYHDPTAGGGHLFVVKSNATARGKKGTIFLNPGGPGVSGLQALADYSDELMARTGGIYDFISWDPRGPRQRFCLSDEDFDAFWGDTIEATGINWLDDFTNQTDLDAFRAQGPIMDAKYREFGERCLQGPNATTLQYVGTAATVRDLVGLADAVLGPDTPIYYWGLSYGTVIGAWFANMFPKRVGRVILDGVLDATRVASSQSYLLWGDQVTSSEDVYSAFANACAMAGPGGCKLAPFEGASGEDVVKYIGRAIEQLHDHPSGTELLSLRGALFGTLYQPQLWAETANNQLSDMITGILNNPSDGAMDMCECLYCVCGVSNPSSTPWQNTLDKRATYTQHSYTEPAVVCADSVDADPSLTIEDIFHEILDVTRNVSRSFGSFWPIPWHRCSYWPVRAVERYQGPFNGTYANKVLVIGNSYDGATPFFEAQHMAEIMGDQAALVKQDGFGHTSIYQSSECVKMIIKAYLEDGTVPAGNASVPTICPVDDSVRLFPGVKSVDVSVNATLVGRV
ncbi:alpha/beta-hydrolase [Earliella scabrosa]|nr:alpha/beta-hydrolase [Earliella scabrosa]